MWVWRKEMNLIEIILWMCVINIYMVLACIAADLIYRLKVTYKKILNDLRG